MKQFFTKENGFSIYDPGTSGHTGPAPLADEVSSKTKQLSESRKELQPDLPNPQIIKNILNYARSFEVLKPSTGSAIFLIRN